MYDSVFMNVVISHSISFTKAWQRGFNASGESMRTQNSTDIGSQFLAIMILMMVEVSRTGANAKLKFILQNGVRVSSCPSPIQNGPISKMVSASPKWLPCIRFFIMRKYSPCLVNGVTRQENDEQQWSEIPSVQHGRFCLTENGLAPFPCCWSSKMIQQPITKLNILLPSHTITEPNDPQH